MALNPSGKISIGGPTAGQSVNLELSLSATANSSLNQANFRALAGVASGVISLSNFYGKSSIVTTTQGIWAFGNNTPGFSNTSVKISSTGVMSSDQAGVGTARGYLGACTYGGDKGIFAYGRPSLITSPFNISNLVSNTGVVATDSPGVGTAREQPAAVPYGNGLSSKGLMALGYTGSSNPSIANMISELGVVASDLTISAAGRYEPCGTGYGGDKGIMLWGTTTTAAAGLTSSVNFVTNTGVIGSDTATSGSTPRYATSAATYGMDKAIVGCGVKNLSGANSTTNIYNLISNTGVIAADITQGSNLQVRGSCGYGNDKAAFTFGTPGTGASLLQNLISNTGVVAASVTLTGIVGRRGSPGCGFSYA